MLHASEAYNISIKMKTFYKKKKSPMLLTMELTTHLDK